MDPYIVIGWVVFYGTPTGVDLRWVQFDLAIGSFYYE